MILLPMIISFNLNFLAFSLMNLVQRNYFVKLITTLVILNIGLLKEVLCFNLISIIVGAVMGMSIFAIMNAASIADAYEESEVPKRLNGADF